MHVTQHRNCFITLFFQMQFQLQRLWKHRVLRAKWYYCALAHLFFPPGPGRPGHGMPWGFCGGKKPAPIINIEARHPEPI